MTVKEHKKMKIITGGVVPLVILLSMIVMPLYTIYFGQEIFLETIPYDPRDIFRGDHVVLDYKINEVPIEKFPDILKELDTYEKYYNKEIYAVLKEENGYHTIDYMTYIKPKDRVFLTSRLRYFYPFKRQNGEIKAIHMNYNLDKYFVPENTGKELEEMSRRGELIARVKVYNGYSILLDIKPKQIDFEN